MLGLKYDSDYVSTQLKSINGPVIIVGCSYTSSLIIGAAIQETNVKSVVFVADLHRTLTRVPAGWARSPQRNFCRRARTPVLQPEGKQDPAFKLSDISDPSFAPDTYIRRNRKPPE
ncbi:hypothetical protein BN77_4348 [Rhizobium mesoamericanum STM3625]|uniref:Uncharacterized protein n=1 Tax=Rhizobium mesoamericanum STM3625 TaxID=1211777 RepID=K0PZM3_9HYPH|nr:hypothetical protein BN77_4348 [Rhizobium mesoamericanum STM3625]